MVLGSPGKVVNLHQAAKSARRPEMVGTEIWDNGAYCLKHGIGVVANANLTFSTMSYIMYDMSVITRDFIKRFSHYKRQAMTGAAVRWWTGRQGYVFKLENRWPCRQRKTFVQGHSVNAPVDPSEWKELM